MIRPEIKDGQNLEKVLRDDKFTAREIELALLLMDGKSNQEISDELFVSTQTVKNYISKMYRQIGVKTILPPQPPGLPYFSLPAKPRYACSQSSVRSTAIPRLLKWSASTRNG